MAICFTLHTHKPPLLTLPRFLGAYPRKEDELISCEVHFLKAPGVETLSLQNFAKKYPRDFLRCLTSTESYNAYRVGLDPVPTHPLGLISDALWVSPASLVLGNPISWEFVRCRALRYRRRAFLKADAEPLLSMLCRQSDSVIRQVFSYVNGEPIYYDKKMFESYSGEHHRYAPRQNLTAFVLAKSLAWSSNVSRHRVSSSHDEIARPRNLNGGLARSITSRSRSLGSART